MRLGEVGRGWVRLDEVGWGCVRLGEVGYGWGCLVRLGEVGSGWVLEKISGNRSGSGWVGVFKYKVFSGIFFTLGYSWVFSGISGYIGSHFFFCR